MANLIYSIKKERFIELSREVASYFSNCEESFRKVQNLFYSPFKAAERKGSKPINTSGVLYDKYLYCRKKLIRIGKIKREERIAEGNSYCDYSISFTKIFKIILYLYEEIC